MARHIMVYGTVQGVFFRQSTVEQARLLGVTGWVRNLPEGTVEIWAEGSSEALEQLVAWAWQGPPAARVSDVYLQEKPDQGHGAFTLRR